MRVADVMTTAIEFIGSDEVVREAAALMGELDVGALPVGTDTRLEGVVTDRDILYRVVARGLDPATTKLAAILSRPALVCRETDSLQAAMDLMASNHVRRLGVENEAGRIIGWLTLGDLSRTLLVDAPALQEALTGITGERDPPASDTTEPSR